MTGHCKDCRWWAQNDIALVYGDTMPDYELRVCRAPKHCVGVGVPPRDGATFFAVAEYGYEDIITGPDFGCVNFEAKE